eukprot:CAMPEP_0174727590 /NCGR_PEP_ID=MMETSP1094-20130205/50094_1 /TAXON_ID=156173 /ORGANISM="Chrysochromulina brevifilum, Strain UTEX LB 985" /LENGTH=82 /DNA_ID=CAMNT_0015929365 /DNA_START=115 /DNA_END=363 /DNA_ORIENTATION=+
MSHMLSRPGMVVAQKRCMVFSNVMLCEPIQLSPCSIMALLRCFCFSLISAQSGSVAAAGSTICAFHGRPSTNGASQFMPAQD